MDKEKSKDNSLEEAKKLAAVAAVDEFIKSGMKVGIGSGSTIVYVVKRIKERIESEKLDIICIPTSFQSEQLIINGLTIIKF